MQIRQIAIYFCVVEWILQKNICECYIARIHVNNTKMNKVQFEATCNTDHAFLYVNLCRYMNSHNTIYFL